MSVAQVARRYAMNANMIFTWLRDPRYAPEAGPTVEASATDVVAFLPVEVVDGPQDEGPRLPPDLTAGTIEIDVAGGHRLRIVGAYDPEALARLIRGLSA